MVGSRLRKRRIDDLLSASVTILNHAEGPLGLVPIPGLSVAAGALLKLIEMVQVVRANKAACLQLAESLQSLTVLLESISHKIQKQIKIMSLASPEIAAGSQELSDRVKRLSDDIENALTKGQELLKGSVITRFFRGSDDAATFQSLDKEIQQAQSRFQLQGNVSIEMMVNEVISTIHTAELERQLSKLRNVDAGYRAPVNARKSRWLEGTRTQLLQDITEWSQGLGTDRIRTNAPIFVLTGGAGTGKSTIAVQVAKSFDEAGVLGGSFFFERGVEELSSTRYLFPTLAIQLARMHHYLAPYIVKGIAKHQEKSTTQNLMYALDELLVEPLSEVPQDERPLRPIIFVLDALDECSDQDQVPGMLYLLLKRMRSLSFPIRLFLTTRPEYHIQDAFTSLEWQSEPEPYQLMSIPMNIVRDDIKRFIDTRLADIGLDQKLKSIQDDAVKKLTDAANGLFIYASTCIEFLGRYKHDLRETLALVLNHAMNVDTLDALYDIVLSKAFSENDIRHPHLGPSIPVVLGALSAMQEQLLPVHLSVLLQLKTPILNEVLDRLRSVLTYGADEPIRLLHASFPQYLVDPTRCRLPKISDVPSFRGHDYLARRCLEILLDGENLKRNICDLPDPLVHRNEITDLGERRARSISPSIEYACLHWSFHLCRSSPFSNTTNLFKDFMQRKLLQWMETLGIIDRLDIVVAALSCVLEWYKVNDQTRTLLSDGYRFILTFFDVILACPFQVYISGLGFAPSKSALRSVYASEVDGISAVDVLTGPEETWGPSLRVLEGRTVGMVSCIVFSHSGQWFASAGLDCCIKIWDAVGAILLRTLSGQGMGRMEIAFSPDDTLIFGSSGDTIRVWNTISGAPLRVLQLTAMVVHISLLPSPPDTVEMIAATISTKTGCRVQILDLDGRILSSLVDGLSSFAKAECSMDGRYLAVAQKCKIVLYDMKSFSVWKELVGHKNYVIDIKLIPQSDLLVSASMDTTFRLWQIKSQTCIHVFEGRSGPVTAVAVSPSKGLIASVTLGPIRTWSIQEKACVAAYSAPTMFHAFSFSPDGNYLVTAGLDIRLWDVNQTPHLVCLPEWIGTISLDWRFMVLRNAEENRGELWSLEDDHLVATIKGMGNEKDRFSRVAASSDGAWVAVIWSSGVSLFDMIMNRETSYPGITLAWKTAMGRSWARGNDAFKNLEFMGISSDGKGVYTVYTLPSQGEGTAKVQRWFLFSFHPAIVEVVEDKEVPLEYLERSRLQHRFTVQSNGWLVDRWASNRHLCWIPLPYRPFYGDKSCRLYTDGHNMKYVCVNKSKKLVILDLRRSGSSEERWQTSYNCLQRADKGRYYDEANTRLPKSSRSEWVLDLCVSPFG